MGLGMASIITMTHGLDCFYFLCVLKLLNQSSISHKDIARQQAGSSIFPWQQEQTPSKRRNAVANTTWNTEETPLRQSSFMAQGDSTGNSNQAEQLKALNQGQFAFQNILQYWQEFNAYII